LFKRGKGGSLMPAALMKSGVPDSPARGWSPEDFDFDAEDFNDLPVELSGCFLFVFI
jgi:hypothetical protein